MGANTIEITDTRLVCDGEHQDFAAFFTTPEREDANARACSCQGSGVSVGFLRTQ